MSLFVIIVSAFAGKKTFILLMSTIVTVVYFSLFLSKPFDHSTLFYVLFIPIVHAKEHYLTVFHVQTFFSQTRSIIC